MTFQRWLENGKTKDYCYHQGNLAIDGIKSQNAKDAWKAYEAGLVELVQKKVSDGVYLYYAQRRKGKHNG